MFLKVSSVEGLGSLGVTRRWKEDENGRVGSDEDKLEENMGHGKGRIEYCLVVLSFI